jgi:hypothetical protein
MALTTPKISIFKIANGTMKESASKISLGVETLSTKSGYKCQMAKIPGDKIATKRNIAEEIS